LISAGKSTHDVGIPRFDAFSIVISFVELEMKVFLYQKF
jgi:hypothetical protein